MDAIFLSLSKNLKKKTIINTIKYTRKELLAVAFEASIMCVQVDQSIRMSMFIEN